MLKSVLECLLTTFSSANYFVVNYLKIVIEVQIQVSSMFVTLFLLNNTISTSWKKSSKYTKNNPDYPKPIVLIPHATRTNFYYIFPSEPIFSDTNKTTESDWFSWLAFKLVFRRWKTVFDVSLWSFLASWRPRLGHFYCPVTCYRVLSCFYELRLLDWWNFLDGLLLSSAWSKPFYNW